MASTPTPTLACGARVRLHGLSSRGDLNNLVGTIEFYDESRGRYAVSVPEAGAAPLLLKGVNLMLDKVPSAPPPAAADEGAECDAILQASSFALLREKLQTLGTRPGTRTFSQAQSTVMGGTSRSRGIQAIVAVVRSGAFASEPAAVVQQACDALSTLCVSGEALRDAVRRADAATACVQVLRGEHGFEAVSAATGEVALAEEPVIVECGDQGVGDVDEAAPVSACDSVVAASPPLPSEQPVLIVARSACQTLTNLANGDVRCKQAVADADGAATLVAAMRAACDDERLVITCVGGLANIAGDAQCFVKVLQAGGVREVVGAMRRFSRSSPLLSADACLAIANFTASKGEGAVAVCEEGGVQAVIAAIRAHVPREPKVREWAAAALANLASNSAADVREMLIDEGAARAAVTILRACQASELRTQSFAVGGARPHLRRLRLMHATLRAALDGARRRICRLRLLHTTLRLARVCMTVQSGPTSGETPMDLRRRVLPGSSRRLSHAFSPPQATLQRHH